VNDSLVNQTDSVISYFFKLGTNKIKLVVIDNDNGRDSSVATIRLSSLSKIFKGGILGGISALNQNTIITADATYDPILGSSIVVLNRFANTTLSLNVQSKIFTTPSISTDSLIFITNGSNLNGYSKAGVALWSTIPLGGISYVTPTIDSTLGRIYLGVSNKNFFAYDYKTGKNIWNYLCDAPVNTSAVITLDRKLIFTSQSGTLYGFDISKSEVQTTPKWKVVFGDLVLKSPAVDANNDIYVGTDAGRFIKFKLNNDGSILVKWNITLSASIQSSPVIDADGYVYIGNEKGDFYKIDPISGKVLWTYNVNASIRSTPSISEFGVIYVATTKGDIFAINADKVVKWKYSDSSSISANILYIKNMLYFANENGLLTGIYDNPNSITVNTSFSSSHTNHIFNNRVNSFASNNNYFNISLFDFYSSSKNNQNYVSDFIEQSALIERKPIWGTFQGDYRRSGSLSVECPQNLTISKDEKGNLVSSYPYKIGWYKNGSILSGIDSNLYKPTESANYSIKSNIVGCESIISQSYYYLITDVINISSDEFIKLVPNPFINQLNFDFVIKGYEKLNIEIFDLATGSRKASMQNLTPGLPIYLGQLSAGTYFIKVSSNDGKINYQFKMIKL
jgi:outer membrane protein assembly factor BamB